MLRRERRRLRVEYHPLGVIGVIGASSFPLQNVVGPTIPALMAGNAVIVKVSEWLAWSAPRLQAIFDHVLRACGHDQDLVQVVNGLPEAGAALGRGVAIVVNMFNPQMVVVGGEIAEAGELLLDPMRRAMELGALGNALAELRLVPGELGRRAALRGALRSALASTF